MAMIFLVVNLSLRAKRNTPYNETYDHGLVKDEVPDSDIHDDELVSTDDDLVALELLRDQEIGFLAYITISRSESITA